MRTYRYVPLYYFYFYWSLYNYAAHAADILTPTTVVQGEDNHSWDLIQISEDRRVNNDMSGIPKKNSDNTRKITSRLHGKCPQDQSRNPK